jgi:hypothetical protein
MASGFQNLDGRLMKVFTLPHSGYDRTSEGGSVIGGAGPGATTFNAFDSLTVGYREKLIMYIENDGEAGCSNNDILAAVITDPITGPLTFSFSPGNLPRTAQPAKDLHDCNKFLRDGITVGDFDVIVRGSEFTAQEGRSVLVGDLTGPLATGTIRGGSFEVVVPKYVWEAEDAGLLALIDGNNDGHCGGDSDVTFVLEAGHATADQKFELRPDQPGFPIPTCW